MWLKFGNKCSKFLVQFVPFLHDFMGTHCFTTLQLKLESDQLVKRAVAFSIFLHQDLKQQGEVTKNLTTGSAPRCCMKSKNQFFFCLSLLHYIHITHSHHHAGLYQKMRSGKNSQSSVRNKSHKLVLTTTKAGLAATSQHYV